MDKIFKHKLLKYVTPLGILSLVFFLGTIFSIIKIAMSTSEPGFGGLIIVVLGIVFLASFFLDRFLSILLERKLNIKVQSIIVSIFLFLLLLLIF